MHDRSLVMSWHNIIVYLFLVDPHPNVRFLLAEDSFTSGLVCSRVSSVENSKLLISGANVCVAEWK